MFDPEVENMRFKIARLVLEQEDENQALIPVYDPVVPVAEILCKHLKFSMSTIIHRMAMQKKNCLLSRALLKRENDPKNLLRELRTKVVRENTLFTAEDFFHMPKDNRDLIPPRPTYNLFIHRLLTHMSMKRSLEIKRSLEMKRLKQKEEEEEEDDDDDEEEEEEKTS